VAVLHFLVPFKLEHVPVVTLMKNENIGFCFRVYPRSFQGYWKIVFVAVSAAYQNDEESR
jgi:hypothetical protein